MGSLKDRIMKQVTNKYTLISLARSSDNQLIILVDYYQHEMTLYPGGSIVEFDGRQKIKCSGAYEEALEYFRLNKDEIRERIIDTYL
jgi:hypothetical protein